MQTETFKRRLVDLSLLSGKYINPFFSHSLCFNLHFNPQLIWILLIFSRLLKMLTVHTEGDMNVQYAPHVMTMHSVAEEKFH